MHEITALSTALSKQNFMFKLVAMPANIFKNDHNRLFFECMKELAEKNDIVDMSMILSQLELKGKKLDNIDKILKADISLNPTGLLKTIQAKANAETIKINAVELYNSVKSGNLDIEHFIENIQNSKITEDINMAGELSDFAETPLDDIFAAGDFIKTGLPLLDEYILGLGKGQLICIAGTPGKGKTTLAFQIACSLNSYFVSMEMSRKQLYAKYLSSRANIETFQIYKKSFSEAEFKRIMNAREESKNLNIKIHDGSSNLYVLLSSIKDEVKKGKTVAFVDYLQLITDAPGFNQPNQIEHTTRALKSLAMELKIPIIMLSQLTKDVTKEDREPNSGDLLGSGSIHQNSDVVIFTWERKLDTEGREVETLIKIDKCKEGKTGNIQGFYFNKKYCRFEEIKISTQWNNLPNNTKIHENLGGN